MTDWEGEHASPPRWPRWVAAATLLITALALYPASRLRPSVELADLLPEHSPSAAAYRTFLTRFEGAEKIFVVIRLAGGGSDRERLLEGAWALEQQLEGRPGIAAVRSGVQEADEEFFLRWVAPRAPLLMPEDRWLEGVESRVGPAAVHQRVARLRREILLPGRDALAPLLRRDPLGFFEELPAANAVGSALPLDLLTSTFLSPTGRASLVSITPTAGELDPRAGGALAAELERAFAAVRAEVGSNLEFLAAGGPLYAFEDERIIRHDLRSTLGSSILGCALILVAAFGGLRIPLATAAAVAAGLAWLAAGLALGLGQVSATSLGFAAVLVGLGFDYGIHTGTRFREARLAGADPRWAWRQVVREAGPAIVGSALTTAAGFGVLVTAGLRPLRELGLVVGVGILAVLVATFTLGAALLVGLRRHARFPKESWLWRGLGRTVELVVNGSADRWRWVLVAAMLATVAAVPGMLRLEVRTDLSGIRPSDHPTLAAEVALHEEFGFGPQTVSVLVPGADLGSALARAGAAAGLLRAELPHGAQVTSPADFLSFGASVDRRLEHFAALPLLAAAASLEGELAAANLDPQAFAPGIAALRSLGRGEDPGAPPPESWPDWLSESVRQPAAGAAAGDPTWVAIHLRLPPGAWPTGPPASLLLALEVAAPGVQVASAGAVGGELEALAREDLGRLAVLAWVAVTVVVSLSLRGRLAAIGLSLLPVSLGTIWTLGLWGWIDGSLDLLQLTLVPIVLGIGIDDGLHAVHGANRAGGAVSGLTASVLASGRAMALTTVTTCFGFGSLALSSLPSLRRGGLTIGIGVALCLVATWCVLPAVQRLFAAAGDEPAP